MFENADLLAQRIDHTLVRPSATFDDLERACADARRWKFAALVVQSSHVAAAVKSLNGTMVKVGAVVGFPHGMSTTTVKIVEAMEALKNGASELDIVMNVGLIKSGKLEQAEIDLKNVIAMTKTVVHKAIVETGLLTPGELETACKIALRSGAEFIKTSTGFGPRGATVEDIRLIRTVVGDSCRIKASGGIRDLAAVLALTDAGADRIGTSNGPAIMEEYLKAGKR